MDRIRLDGLGEVLAYGAFSGVRGVGGAHHAAPLDDRVRALDDGGHERTARDELDQVGEEGLVLVLAVVRLGDLYGTRRTFIAGAGIFAAGSFLASIATSVWMLVLGEAVIEGVGAALLMPASLATISMAFTGRDRAKAADAT